MTLIRLFAIGKILGIELVPSDEVKIPPHKSICYARMRILLGGLSDCEELVGVTWSFSDCEELVGVTHRR